MKTPTDPYHLLFVCTANICRSPMAEGWAIAYAQTRGWTMEVRSGGVMGLIGKPAASNAIRVMKEKDVDISNHQSSAITQDVVDWADYILVMELNHAIKLRKRFPELGDQILMLGNFGGMIEVKDPIGGWRWKFRRSRDEIRRCVEAFMDSLPPRIS